MAPQTTAAVAALKAAEQKATAAADAHRAADKIRADAERELGAIRAELQAADPNKPAFAEIVQKRTVAEARLESLAARVRPTEVAMHEANIAVTAARVAAQHEEIATLHERTRKLEADIRQRARAFATEAGKNLDELHALMLEGARRMNDVSRVESGRPSGVFLAFSEEAGFADNLLRGLVTQIDSALDADEARRAAAKGRA